MTYRAPTQPYQTSKSSDNGMKILVIVIIVVLILPIILAGVLYIMVMGFGGSPTLTPSNGSGYVMMMDSETIRMEVLTMNNPPTCVDCEFEMSVNGFSAEPQQILGQSINTYYIQGVFYDVFFSDMNDNYKIDEGDFFIITSLLDIGHHDVFELEIIFSPTGDVILSTLWESGQ